MVNLGTGGVACNGTAAGGVTLGQTGQLGANEAFLWDADNEIITVTNQAAWDSLTTWEWCFLVKPTAANPDTGRLFDVSSKYRIVAGSTLLLDANAPAVTTAARSLSSTALTANVWQLVSCTFDNAGDRKVRIYINDTEVSYTTQTAADGDYAIPGEALRIGNSAAREWIGLMDEILLFNTIDATRRQKLLDFFSLAA